MGDRIEASALIVGHDEQVRHRLERSVALLRDMVSSGAFCGHEDTMGMEVELDIVDPLGRPRLINDTVLACLDRSDMTHELGRFNIEFNLAPQPLQGRVLHDCQQLLTEVLDRSGGRIAGLGARLISVGTLPTAAAEHMTAERLSTNPRYALMSRRLRAARHRGFRVRIPEAIEPVDFSPDSVALEACATSLQLHLRVEPELFAAYYNAAQLIAGVQVAVAANSPFLLGNYVWEESRIPMMEQLFDSRRPGEVKANAAARVELGEGWIDGPVDLFDSLVRLYPPLLPTLESEDPDTAYLAGRTPALHELRLHNGTVWLWNRPVYDVQSGAPQLRIENRVLPSGPTPVDMVSNAAFYYGLVRAIVDSGRVPWTRTPFAVAERDLHRAARFGLAAVLSWEGEDRPAAELVADVLVPIAADGLDAWGIAQADRDHYLGVIEARARSGRNGASWQAATVQSLQDCGAERITALHEMTRRYVENAHTGTPVHDWPLS